MHLFITSSTSIYPDHQPHLPSIALLIIMLLQTHSTHPPAVVGRQCRSKSRRMQLTRAFHSSTPAALAVVPAKVIVVLHSMSGCFATHRPGATHHERLHRRARTHTQCANLHNTSSSFPLHNQKAAPQFPACMHTQNKAKPVGVLLVSVIASHCLQAITSSSSSRRRSSSSRSRSHLTSTTTTAAAAAASQAASSSSSSSEAAKLKQQLLQSIEGLDRGIFGVQVGRGIAGLPHNAMHRASHICAAVLVWQKNSKHTSNKLTLAAAQAGAAAGAGATCL